MVPRLSENRVDGDYTGIRSSDNNDFGCDSCNDMILNLNGVL